MPDFLTTKEVAALLRIKERKVYELVAENAIPVSRVTGKLIFPRELVEAWVRRRVDFAGGTESLAQRPAVIAGSHDPLLDWALRESGSELATFFDGSLDGLARVAAGKALGAGLHVYEPDPGGAGGDWNLGELRRAAPGLPLVLIAWAWRRQGLVLPPGNPRGIAGLEDLAGLTLVPRQQGAGSTLLLGHLLEQAGMALSALTLLQPPARNEADVALAVAAGKADAGFAVETVARQHRLDFLPLFRERYDLLLWRRDAFEPPLQRLLAFCRSEAFAARAAELGGYDLTDHGQIRYNGP
ncbi:MAG: helix-turn-helix transcriptional regulator [Kiloniellales bacterium]|nr:helix-turn-helix transcriptional regulator [Kiloniellales bacterium]